MIYFRGKCFVIDYDHILLLCVGAETLDRSYSHQSLRYLARSLAYFVEEITAVLTF